MGDESGLSTLASIAEDDSGNGHMEATAKDSSLDGSSELTSTQNVAVGVYLVIAGILSIVGNGSLLCTFARFRRLLTCPYRLMILNFCAADFIMTSFAGFLFSGTSSIAGRWLFGDKGCQYYAFGGFFFGNAILMLITAMAIVRCLLGMKKPPITVTKRGIRNVIYFVWIWSLFWSVLPLLGWSSYDYEPGGLSCTINWKENDQYYVSYMLCLVVFVFTIPAILSMVCIFSAFKELKKEKSIESSTELDSISQSKGVKMSFWLLVTYLIFWSPYAILCLWVVFLPPETVPVFISLSPPLIAKFSVVLHPLIIITFDDSLRKGVLACLLCQKTTEEITSSPETVRMTASTNED